MEKNSKKIGVLPLGDRVLVKSQKSEEKEKTKSGIYIPQSVNNDKGSDTGEVVAVGEGRYQDGTVVPIKVKVGDTVMFSKYGYDEIKIKGEDYLILKEENILAIIK